MFCEKGLNGLVNSIDTCQSLQSMQADIGQNFLLSLNFWHVRGTNLHSGSLSCVTKLILWIHDEVISCLV